MRQREYRLYYIYFYRSLDTNHTDLDRRRDLDNSVQEGNLEFRDAVCDTVRRSRKRSSGEVIVTLERILFTGAGMSLMVTTVMRT
jgi:hypothetical protein